MFRCASNALVYRAFLHRCQPIDFHFASLKRLAPNNALPIDPRARAPCPVPPPPPPKGPKDDAWFWGGITVLIIGSAGIVMAKHNPEVRDWLSINAPWVDDIVAIAYRENMTYTEFAESCIEDLQKRYHDLVYGKKEICLPDCTLITEFQEKIDENPDGEEIVVCKKEPPPVITQGICEIERCMEEIGDFVIINYDTAKEACSYYNGLVDETMDHFSVKALKELAAAKEERECLVNESLKNATHALDRFNEMARYLDCGVDASKEEIDNVKLLHRDYQDRQTIADIEYQWENDKSLARDRQWQMVDEGVTKYTSENEAVYPELKYTDERPTISRGDLDILLYNTAKYVEKLNEELKEKSEAMKIRVTRAYKMLPQGDNCELAKARKEVLKTTLAKRRAEIEKDIYDRCVKQNQENEQLLQELTKKQAERHEKLLETRLQQREDQMSAEMEKMIEVEVGAERRVLAKQMEDMTLQLKILEDKLNARIKAERDARRSQKLWAAGAALLEATKKGEPVIDISKEINAIEKATDEDDKLVKALLKSIPKSVRESGIVPESVLKKNYETMEQTALRVAMVEEDGGAMHVWFISLIQSLLLFMKVPGIPQEEFEKPPKEVCKSLDTFDILQRVRFWVQRDNLATALNYMQHLKGASRLIANQWMEEATAHLKVRQAAEALLAHAAAMGLRYI